MIFTKRPKIIETVYRVHGYLHEFDKEKGVDIRVNPYQTLEKIFRQTALQIGFGPFRDCDFGEEWNLEYLDDNHNYDCHRHTRQYLMPGGLVVVKLNPWLAHKELLARVNVRRSCRREPRYIKEILERIGPVRKEHEFKDNLDEILDGKWKYTALTDETQPLRERLRIY